MFQVGIAGVPGDATMKKTKIKEDNWTPVWDEEFIFQLTVPELALLRVEVHEYDMSEKDDFAGQTCLPVSELRPGIRTVPLFDRKGEKLNSSRLLMRFEFVQDWLHQVFIPRIYFSWVLSSTVLHSCYCYVCILQNCYELIMICIFFLLMTKIYVLVYHKRWFSLTSNSKVFYTHTGKEKKKKLFPVVSLEFSLYSHGSFLVIFMHIHIRQQ